VGPPGSEHPRFAEGCSLLLQCGSCTGTVVRCQYTWITGPRRIIGLAREGFRKEVLNSQTIWLCASCYSCAVHCPQQIHITDVMYNFKREAIRSHLYPNGLPSRCWPGIYNVVRRNGRNVRVPRGLRMACGTKPPDPFHNVAHRPDLLRDQGGWKLNERETEARTFCRRRTPDALKTIPISGLFASDAPAWPNDEERRALFALPI